MRFLSPNGLPIVGTLETLKARAEATEYSATGDEDGYEWVFSDLVPEDEDEDEEAAA